ncbi:hypothetical protein [Aristophania vespae]|uniref:hypothetical protein n=1 Tax=Aristophania vespae TaxID=2697033 RepID=UPI002351597D|nr:hypothetical protein [Aristophania vespae]UMM63730.1 hypothetical protein DM15PD_07060 [Aristophania vespae]
MKVLLLLFLIGLISFGASKWLHSRYIAENHPLWLCRLAAVGGGCIVAVALSLMFFVQVPLISKILSDAGHKISAIQNDADNSTEQPDISDPGFPNLFLLQFSVISKALSDFGHEMSSLQDDDDDSTKQLDTFDPPFSKFKKTPESQPQ